MRELPVAFARTPFACASCGLTRTRTSRPLKLVLNASDRSPAATGSLRILAYGVEELRHLERRLRGELGLSAEPIRLGDTHAERRDRGDGLLPECAATPLSTASAAHSHVSRDNA